MSIRNYVIDFVSIICIGLTGVVDAARGGPVAKATFASSGRLIAPIGAEQIPFENLDGLILVRATLRGRDRDTSGVLAVDTGAGYLAIDSDLAFRLGLADSIADQSAIDFVPRALPRLELGGLQLDQVGPILTVDTDVIREVTDRPVLGLLGQAGVGGRALWIDYAAARLVLIPIGHVRDGLGSQAGGGRADEVADKDVGPKASAEVQSTGEGAAPHDGGSAKPGTEAEFHTSASRALFGRLLGARAIPIPFRLKGDGKILVRARVSDPRPPRWSDWLTLILDTGATKSVLFEEAVDEVPHASEWPELRGLIAPTLLGASDARVVRVPEVQLAKPSGSLSERGIDVAILSSDLSGVLSRAVEEPVHGLLGYSFLRHFRLGIDYAHRIVWLDPIAVARDTRPYEYSQVGMQLERKAGQLRVAAVAKATPAAEAGIAPGDFLVAVDGRPVVSLDLGVTVQMLEGKPGSRVSLTLRRGLEEQTYRLTRRRLL